MAVFLRGFLLILLPSMRDIRDEATLWCMAGAKGVQSIWQ
jgi:hypothetical protein